MKRKMYAACFTRTYDDSPNIWIDCYTYYDKAEIKNIYDYCPTAVLLSRISIPYGSGKRGEMFLKHLISHIKKLIKKRYKEFYLESKLNLTHIELSFIHGINTIKSPSSRFLSMGEAYVKQQYK